MPPGALRLSERVCACVPGVVRVRAGWGVGGAQGGLTEWCFGICVCKGDVKCHHHQRRLILRNSLLMWTDNPFPTAVDMIQINSEWRMCVCVGEHVCVCATMSKRDVTVFCYVIRCPCANARLCVFVRACALVVHVLHVWMCMTKISHIHSTFSNDNVDWLWIW